MQCLGKKKRGEAPALSVAVFVVLVQRGRLRRIDTVTVSAWR